MKVVGAAFGFVLTCTAAVYGFYVTYSMPSVHDIKLRARADPPPPYPLNI